MGEKYILCLDGGTTNTRIRLVENGKIIDSVSSHTGSNKKNNVELRQCVKELIDELLKRHSLSADDIPYIMACGMVSSELGLFVHPHILTPAGAAELKKGIREVVLSDITDIPIRFIPGIKENCPEPNMMRGEETECVGLLSAYKINEPVAVILPGTHNKVISFDGERVTALYSMMSGEILAALSGHTILKNTMPESLPKEFDEDALIEGAEECRRCGLTGAALRERSIGLTNTKSDVWLSSFLAGAVLYCDIIAIKEKSGGKKLLIGGSLPLREEIAVLCRHFLQNEVLTADNETAVNASVTGALLLS